MGETLVEADQTTLAVKNADALIDVFKRRADQLGLIVHQAAALHPFEADDVRDVGLHDDGLTVFHAMFGYLNPAVPDKADVEHHMFFAVTKHPLTGPIR